MRIRLRWPSLVVFAVSLFICQEAVANSLTGKVIEVNDGDEITVSNLNRPVRIKLVAIDAPEKDQAFGAAAKQHLFDLVYDKFVTVEYSGIGEHSSLLGRVVLIINNSDICAQMIRDGAAWFDPSNKNLLNETQREIYRQSELAARNERRGLWQVDGAVAPWEFVKAEKLKAKESVTVAPKGAEQSVTWNRPTPELTSVNLLKTGTALPPQNPITLESSDKSWLTDGPYRKTWRRLQPVGEPFSVLVPSGGEQASRVLPLGRDNTNFNVSYYRARDGESVFEVVWFNGPASSETDDGALESGINSILGGLGDAAEQRGIAFSCNPTSRKIFAPAGFVAREFDLTSCPVPVLARAYTKRDGDSRTLYLAFSGSKEDDPNVMKFLKSFTLSVQPKATKKTSTK